MPCEGQVAGGPGGVGGGEGLAGGRVGIHVRGEDRVVKGSCVGEVDEEEGCGEDEVGDCVVMRAGSGVEGVGASGGVADWLGDQYLLEEVRT